MAALTEQDILAAVTKRMRSSDKYKSRLLDAIDDGNSALLEKLIEKAIEKVFGIIVDIGAAIVRKVRAWLGF